MVNRRLLRIKAMKALYAYKQSELSDFELALDAIAAHYKPDLNSMEPQNLELLEGKKRLAIIEFEEKTGKRKRDDETEVPLDIRNLVLKVYLDYQAKLKSTQNRLSNEVIAEVEKIYITYIQILLLITHLADMAKADQEGRLLKNDLVDFSRLDSNKVVQAIRNSEQVNLKRIKLQADWKSSHMLIIRQFYQDELRGNEEFLAYCVAKSTTVEQDGLLLGHLVKNLIFKGKLLSDYFDERDIHWTENAAAIRSLVLKTVQITDLQEFKLQDLAYNWEDDKQFFTELFKKTWEYDQELEDIILKKVKNWEGDRIAILDSIILKLALTEMRQFTSIPVKVSINEYIELAKTYSTPQSGKFVNGMLEAIANEWQSTGIIKKSGRGLIDNR